MNSDTTLRGSDMRRMYSDLAWLYPIITPPSEWYEEANEIWKTILAKSEIPVRDLLDLGCGAGHIDYHLKDKVRICGVDCSHKMLELAHQLNPEVTYHLGDMRNIRLPILFDAVFISDALIYMLTENDLLEAFTTAYEHLQIGGVLVTYLEAFRDRPEMNTIRYSTNQHNGVTVIHIENYYDPDLTDNIYEMIFLNLIRRDGQLSIEADRHLGGIFKVDIYRNLLIQVGFTVNETVLKTHDVPLFVCLKKGQNR